MQSEESASYSTEGFAMRTLTRSAAGLALALLLSYPADWVVWRTKVALGGGVDSVEVSRVVVTQLKGNKEAYYPDGKMTVDCSRSLFQQTGSGACWWLRRHHEVIERY